MMTDLHAIHQLNRQLEKAFSIRGINTDALLPETGQILTDVAIDNGLIDTGTANLILEDVSGVPFLNPTLATFQESFITHATTLIPRFVAEEEHIFAVRHEADYIHLVMAVPSDRKAIRKLEYITGSRIKRYCCHTQGILESISQYYKDDVRDEQESHVTLERLIEKAVSAIHNLKLQQIPKEEIANHVTVIKLFKYLLNHLVDADASDLHFEPLAEHARIRFRKDGVMQVLGTYPTVIGEALINRVKLISKMRFDTSDVPQDGSIDYHVVENREIDIRVSALPSLYGEKVVLRILAADRGGLTLKDLGMEIKEATWLDSVLKQPSGMILVTGPTGSGKTTTLYAILQALNSEHVNIITAEDPVEYKLSGITQVNCDTEDGLTFSRALRSFLRQDPDVIMVGEIRDRETADMALKASMTGHLVFSTLHTNDASSAINRLVNMGIPAYLVASAQVTVIAQRLVRKICHSCKTRDEKAGVFLKHLNTKRENGEYFIGRGCPECAGTGYRGRIGIYEMLRVDDNMVPIILAHEPSATLKNAAIAAGMTTLRDAAIMKLEEGLTTVEEVIRVTMD